MQMLSNIFMLLLTELFWNVVVWLPTLFFSLVFIRLLLGVRMHDLITEVEEHQTAAVGAVLFWTALGFSMLTGRAAGDPATASGTLGENLLWLAIGIGVAIFIFLIGVILVFGALARRHRQSLSEYIQRELRTEHNLSLSLVMGALFIVPIIVAYHMTV